MSGFISGTNKYVNANNYINALYRIWNQHAPYAKPNR